jgi:hypothetical protein
MSSGFKLGSQAVAVALVLCFGGTSATAQHPVAGSPRPERSHKAGKQRANSIAAMPPSTQTAAEPVTPPQVSYENGLLYIFAQNASLSEILDLIHRCAGATIAAPADVNEQVAVRIGPEPASQAIAALLEGSRFNYVIAGSATDPAAIESVNLTLKPSQLEPYVPPATNVAEGLPTQSRRVIKANLTGGDEGEWDDVEVPAATAPITPAASAWPK